jgi:protein SCO1/2
VKEILARARRFAIGACFGIVAASSAATISALATVYPIHGTTLSVPFPGVVIAAIEIPGTSGAQTRRFSSRAPLRSGETFDAYLDTQTRRLEDVHAAPAFVPGLPNRLVTHIATRGDVLPSYQFESQSGRLLRFSDFRGKVVLLSFTYSRCPDQAICPAISGKFSYLQHHLDPHRFQLVTITLDPLHDSPAALHAYGSLFGADARHWSLLTGESAQIKDVIDSFGLDPLQTEPGRIIHGDTLAIIDANGKIADLIPTAGWAPDDVIASAENIAGLASNPLRRFELATVAGILAFCGGSTSTGIVVLDSVVFLLGVVILGGFLIWITRRVIIKERY